VRTSQLRVAWLSLPLLVSGCCYFMPCHPGGYVVGVVTDAISGQAIPNASVRLYYYDINSAPSGCFKLGGADALPFEFGASAPGYKPVVVDATPGFYRATVKLMPVGSPGNSTSTAVDISSEQYAELSRSCP